jgi:plastocyanin
MGGISGLGVLGTGALAALTLAIGAGTPTLPAAGGTIVGVATTKEAAPKPTRVTIDPGICGQTVPDESVVVDGTGHLSNVVVTVPGVKAQQPAEASYTNEKCHFVPHVAFMRPNGAVKMTSKDATLHTMHAAGADGKAFFNISIPVPNMTLSRPVDKAGVVTLSCSTHTWMRGYLHVSDELSSISGADGRFRLEGVPAGTYTLKVWHETLKTTSPLKVTVKDGETVTLDLAYGK